MTPSVSYMILTLLVAVVMPVLGVLNGNKVQHLLTQSPELKTSTYRQTVIMLLLMASLVLLLLWLNGDSLDQIGAAFILNPISLVWLVGINLCFLLIFNSLKLGSRILKKIRGHFQRVMYLVPATKQQYHWSILLAFVAGSAEEIIYRGFLYEQVNLYLSTIPSLILINIVFGLCHWGTGLKNALWSFGLGVIWSISYLLTHSLWFAVVTHILVDIMSMTVGYTISGQPARNPRR